MTTPHQITEVWTSHLKDISRIKKEYVKHGRTDWMEFIKKEPELAKALGVDDKHNRSHLIVWLGQSADKKKKKGRPKTHRAVSTKPTSSQWSIGWCPSCGNDVRSTAAKNFCSECGCPLRRVQIALDL